MKKSFKQLLAAIRPLVLTMGPLVLTMVFCGAIITSCSKDDDDNNNSQQPSAKKYDVTLTFFTYKTIAAFIDCEFSYTDQNGNKSKPVTITGNENGEALTAQEAEYYKVTYMLQKTESFPESKFLEYVAFHYTIKDVPADSKISWETILHVAQGATAPTEAFNYVWPSVMVSIKKDNSVNFKMDISKGTVGESKLDTWFETIIKNREGNAISYASGSLIPGDYFNGTQLY